MIPYTVAGPNTYRMPFGRHEGKPIDTLPHRYLCWLATVPYIYRRHLQWAIEHHHQLQCGRMHRRIEFGVED